jgi:hypothetical protein
MFVVLTLAFMDEIQVPSVTMPRSTIRDKGKLYHWRLSNGHWRLAAVCSLTKALSVPRQNTHPRSLLYTVLALIAHTV